MNNEPASPQPQTPPQTPSPDRDGSRMPQFNAGRFFIGLLILAVGFLFLGQNFGWINLSGIHLDFAKLWPLFLVAIGLSILSFRGFFGALIGLAAALFFVALALMFIFGGGNYLVGSGHVIQEARTVSGFDEVSLEGVGTLEITQGDAESLTVEAEDNIMSKIKTEVSAEKLRISYTDDWFWFFSFRPQKPIVFHLVAKDLKNIELSGVGEAKSDLLRSDTMDVSISGAGKAELGLETAAVRAESSGAGKMTLTGSSDKLTVESSGAGEVDTRNLLVKEADVEVSGAGKVYVNAIEKLTVSVSGAGSVLYRGNPQVTQSVSGAGSVKKLDE